MKKRSVAIFCDFDGTVTRGDTVDLLLETLAHPEWKVIEERWERGEIGSRECMSLQVPMIQGGWPAIARVLETVKVDNSFAAFVNWCKLRHIDISIVSDGIDKVITHLLKRENVSVERIWANQLVESKGDQLSLMSPKAGHRVVCPSGLCKCQVLDQAPAGTLKVVIGDGRSDFCWARNADVLFAKDKLAKHCQANGIAYLPYENFVQVRVALDELLTSDAAAKGTFAEAPLRLAQS
jgi:2-hydroxy-3-keto-5-methylthiopentenyl-1-phosphate phosphatase